MKYYRDAQNKVFAYEDNVNSTFLADAIQQHGLTVITPLEAVATLNTFVLSDSKAVKRDEIHAAFAIAAALPVTDINSIVWSGGFDSAIKMDAAKRMAELAALTSVALFDADNVQHDLTIAEAEAVILVVGADYQTKFATKQALMVAVEAATTEAGLDAVVVSF